MLTLTERAGVAGVPNLREERHGDEGKPAMDLPVSAVALSEDEFGKLLGDPGASQALYRDGPDGWQVPRFPGLEPLRLAGKIEQVYVELWLGERKKPLFRLPGDLKGVVVTLPEAGPPLVSFKVQVLEPGDSVVAELYEHMNCKVRVAVSPLQEDIVEQAMAASEGTAEPAEQEAADEAAAA